MEDRLRLNCDVCVRMQIELRMDDVWPMVYTRFTYAIWIIVSFRAQFCFNYCSQPSGLPINRIIELKK